MSLPQCQELYVSLSCLGDIVAAVEQLQSQEFLHGVISVTLCSYAFNIVHSIQAKP